MTIHFLTGNEHKFREFRKEIPELERLDVGVPEIQASDARQIVKAKLVAASKLHEGPLLVEDTGLYLEAFNGFPGPYIKWMITKVGRKRMVEAVQGLGNTGVEARTLIGFYDGETRFFEGITKGDLVMPQTDSEFDWDAIFRPEGYDKTYAEMTLEEKNKVSQRGKAIQKLRNFLVDNKFI